MLQFGIHMMHILCVLPSLEGLQAAAAHCQA